MMVIVCGAGQVGTTIARHLSTEGMHVTVIDIDEDQVRRVDESYDVRGLVGHASHPATLQEAGARESDMLIAVTHSDEVIMVACQVAYSLFNVKRRILHLGRFVRKVGGERHSVVCHAVHALGQRSVRALRPHSGGRS